MDKLSSRLSDVHLKQHQQIVKTEADYIPIPGVKQEPFLEEEPQAQGQGEASQQNIDSARDNQMQNEDPENNRRETTTNQNAATVAQVCEIFGLVDIEIDAGDRNLSTYKTYQEYVCPLVEKRNPKISMPKIMMLVAAKWRKYSSENGTTSKKNDGEKKKSSPTLEVKLGQRKNPLPAKHGLESDPSIASSSNSSAPTAGASTLFTNAIPLEKRVGKQKTKGNGDDDKTWEEKCRDLLDIVWSKADAAPFRHSVNILEYPDYIPVIAKPMCLHKVKEELAGGKYTSPQEFHRDMMLIFENSRQYNTEPRSPLRLMTVRLQSFYESNVKSVLDYWKSKGNETNYNTSNILTSLNKNVSSPRQKSSMTSRTSFFRSLGLARPVRKAAVGNPFIKSKPARSFSNKFIISLPPNTIHSLPSTSSAVYQEVNQNDQATTTSERNRRSNSASKNSNEGGNEYKISPAYFVPNWRKLSPTIVYSSEDESVEDPSNTNASTNNNNNNNNKVSPASSRSSDNSQMPVLKSIYDDFDSEEEEDEQVASEVDDGADCFDEESPSNNKKPYNIQLRRSSTKRRRHRFHDEDDDEESNGRRRRETRSRGKPRKKYVEESEASE